MQYVEQHEVMQGRQGKQPRTIIGTHLHYYKDVCVLFFVTWSSDSCPEVQEHLFILKWPYGQEVLAQRFNNVFLYTSGLFLLDALGRQQHNNIV